MSENDELTPEEEAELRAFVGSSFPKGEEKASAFHFFNKVVNTTDTGKVANLGEEELNTVRSLKRAELFANEMNLDIVAGYLSRRAEIINATSLSRGMALINAAITSKKEGKTTLRTDEGGKKSKWFQNKTQTAD